jgi:hypothetical protein
MEQPYNHPAFPQPNDPSIIIWRYMDFTKFKWLVEWGRLYMPSADQLGDPFEGTTPEGELEWWRREAANAISEEQQRIIEYNRGLLSRMAKNFRNQYLVSCWTMNQYENHAMWWCYTSQPEAVAIRTTYGTLRKCLPRYVEMGMVRYIDYASARLPSMNLLEHIMHKDVYWHLEQEVRAVAFFPNVGVHSNENLYESESLPGSLVYAPPVDLSYLIHGLVLHPEANSTFEAEIIEICTKNGLARPDPSRRTRKPVF